MEKEEERNWIEICYIVLSNLINKKEKHDLSQKHMYVFNKVFHIQYLSLIFFNLDKETRRLISTQMINCISSHSTIAEANDNKLYGPEGLKFTN